MQKKRKVMFISGTRADYSKIKIFIEYFCNIKNYDVTVLVIGMHNLRKFGNTHKYIHMEKCKFKKVIINQRVKNDMVYNFSLSLNNINNYMKNEKALDMVFVHGDRFDALAGAISANYNNIPVCHIEAGELSGNIDNNIRYCVSAFSNKLLVSDSNCIKNLKDIINCTKCIEIIGNTSIFDKPLCNKKDNAVLLYHPETYKTREEIRDEIKYIMNVIQNTKYNYTIIYPNNDINSDVIIREYNNHVQNKKYKFYQSLPNHEFLKILSEAKFIIGNSSCGIKEAPYYKTITVNIGNRQCNRYSHLNLNSIIDVKRVGDLDKIIDKIDNFKFDFPQNNNTKENFFAILDNVFRDSFWESNEEKGEER